MTDTKQEPLTPEQIKAIREREQNATPGPYTVEVHTFNANWKRIALVARDDEGRYETGYYVIAAENMEVRQEQAALDYRFLAAAANSIPALLAHVDQLEARIDRARRDLDGGNDCFDSLEEVVEAIVRERRSLSGEPK